MNLGMISSLMRVEINSRLTISLLLVFIALVLLFRKVYQIERKNQVLNNEKSELLKTLTNVGHGEYAGQMQWLQLMQRIQTNVGHGEYAGQMLKIQHIYCFDALKASPYFDFVYSLSNQGQSIVDKNQISERQLMSELWDTGYCTMCNKVHLTDVVDVGLLKIYKVIYDNLQTHNLPMFEHWVARVVGVRVRKNSEDFEKLAEKLGEHFGENHGIQPN